MPSREPRRWWIRFPEEARACPACQSSRITVLDVLTVPKTPEGRRVAFITGCHACGVLFVNPLPTSEQLEHYYSDEGTWAVRQAERVKAPPATAPGPRRPDRLLSALARYVPRLAAPGKVLDYGCGDGKFLNRLRARGWSTFGIEPSTDTAFRKHQRLTEVPQDGSFDFVVLNHVLEHVLDPLETLQRLAGSLREGGTLFVSTPRLDTLPEHRDLKYCLSGHRHVMSFSEVCLRGLLARAGFAVIARVDAPELDEAFTAGKPLRLRVVAERSRARPALPERPLAAARQALSGYAAAEHAWAARLRWGVPPRLRAALVEARMNKRFDRKRQADDPVTRQAGG